MTVLTLWQFVKIIISATYLISCQHVEKRNIDKVLECYCCRSKIIMIIMKELWFLDECVGNFLPMAYGED